MNGLVNVLKPSGMSSSDVVIKLKRIFEQKRCGHMGTLDPGAAGVLLVGIGKGARMFDYLLTKSKCYRAIFEFGIETDTLDSFGKITDRCGKVVTLQEIEQALPKFRGLISQIPPKYSALKIDGKKACDLARSDTDFEIAERQVTIYSFDCLREVSKNLFEFHIHCSSGTYIRSLARDLGRAVKGYGIMQTLLRTSSGKFDILDAVTVQELEQAKAEGNLQKFVIPCDVSLDYYPRADIPDEWAEKVKNGLTCEMEGEDGIYRAYFGGVFLGMGTVTAKSFKMSVRLD